MQRPRAFDSQQDWDIDGVCVWGCDVADGKSEKWLPQILKSFCMLSLVGTFCPVGNG